MQVAQPDKQQSKQPGIMTPANIVTLVRICLVPFFVVVLLAPWPEWLSLYDFPNSTKSLIAAIVFVAISCTDWIDGYLARKRNEVSAFGKFVDPLADKILVAAALLALVELGVLPSWPVLIILSREFIVSGVRMMAATQGEVIAASWYGKAKTVAQILAVVLFLVKDSFFPLANGRLLDPLYEISWVVMIIALVLTIFSMLDYLAKARRFIGFESKSDAREREELPVPVTEEDIRDAAEEVIEEASSHDLSICTAESLTGGMVSAALTAVPGSSAVMRGGIVSYVNDVKSDVLGVDAAYLDEFGAVNEKTACDMAHGARTRLDADACVAVTGIAGPGGAEEGKPVGTVWIAVSSRSAAYASLHHFDGDRAGVRMQTVACALKVLQECLLSLAKEKTDAGAAEDIQA